RRNLEQSLFAVLLAAAPTAADADACAPFLEAMAGAARAAQQDYRALVDHPDFMRFFTTVTPIDEIARLRVASRPVRRAAAPGTTPSLHDLRAIPWVMAWTQNRANVPGWYGADAAFTSLGV